MPKPIYKKEKSLFSIAFVLSLLIWGAIIIASKGAVLAVLAGMFVAYLFVQSAFISYIKGTGALVTDNQFPDIRERVKFCARTLEMRKIPGVFILQGNGLMNAFATRFLRRDYIILLSDILDALEDDPDAINFYIGHEMGHIDRKHLVYEPFLSLALVLPLLGAAYSRARESTCDLYGAACCSPQVAQKGIAVLSVGAKRYKTLNVPEYLRQLQMTSGFWMSFHELISSYPWLVKRLARISPPEDRVTIPMRNIFAYIPAIVVPRMNILSLVIIYLIIFAFSFASGASRHRIMSEIERGAESYSETSSYRDDYAPQSGFVASIVEEVNKQLPMRIDEITMLDIVHEGEGGQLIYEYTIESGNINFTMIQKTSYQKARDYWCSSKIAPQLISEGVKIVYRYSDLKAQEIGKFVIDMNACQ